MSINFIFTARKYLATSTKILSVRPVSGLFTSAWIAEAIALGEHLIGCIVGAGLPAMVVNDNACELDKRGALESIASKLAPTGIALSVFPGIV